MHLFESRRGECGFTAIEAACMLIALAIFTVIVIAVVLKKEEAPAESSWRNQPATHDIAALKQAGSLTAPQRTAKG